MVMPGGGLRPADDSVVVGRQIRLDGGVIEYELRGELAAPLEILSGGGTIRNGRGVTPINSAVTGSGALTIEGGFGNGTISLGADLSQFDGTLTFTGGSIGITRELGYDGVIEVRAADLGTLVANPFGSARVHIRPEGSFGVGNGVTANLHLLGGSLRLHPRIGASEPVLDGDLTVEDHSYLFLPAYDPEVPGGSHVASDIALSYLSNLVIAEQAGATTTAQRGLFKHPLNLGGGLSVTHSATLTSYDNPVTISGTIVAATPQATLHLVGNDTFEITGSVDLTNGNSLTILEDGVPAEVEFSGADSVLSGSGTLVGDATISNGGVVAPGNSPGHLTVDGNMEIGGGAVYEWEISDPDGTAGVDWDLLEVDGDLMFSATPDNPWILQLADLSSLLQADAPLLIATAESISGFDPAAVQFEVPAPAGVGALSDRSAGCGLFGWGESVCRGGAGAGHAMAVFVGRSDGVGAAEE